jgi:hypothetical protein
MNIFKKLPCELIDEIADYHDYDKYCKPEHKILLKNILDNIKDMSEILPTIIPHIAWQCWGAGARKLVYSFENENMVGLYDDYEGGGWSDDEENNYGMDYDDTHYYSNISNDTDSYSEEEDDDQQPESWYNGWDSDN